MIKTNLTNVFKRVLLAALFCVVTAAQIYAASAGSSAANFLKIGIGARGAAMGEAQAALAEDVTASYWNPAGLTHMRFQELSLMHYRLVEGIRYNQLFYGKPTEKGAFSLGINMLDYGDIQGYGSDSLPTSTVEAKSTMIQGAYARKFFKENPLSGGFSFKYLNSELAGYKATAPMLDLGLLYPIQTGRMRGLRLAASLRNMGPDIKYDQTGSPLPQQLVLGAGLSALGGNLNAEIDAIQSKDNGSYIATGLEYRLFEMLQLRVGYNGISEFVGNGLTYGIGLRLKQWNLDYAFVPYGDLGNTNRFSVGVRFGKAMQMQSADDQVENAFRRAERQLASGQGIGAYTTLNELLLIAPWHKPSVELKAKIEKQFEEMSVSKNKAKMESEIADAFTNAKIAFDRDELVEAKKGFETILLLQPEHVGSKVYLERIKNRYASLAHESFKQGMDYYAAGDYGKAQKAFEKTLTIDPSHVDAKAQLDKTKDLIVNVDKRAQEMELLAGAGQAYKDGLEMYQKNNLEGALAKFTEVKVLMPEYEEVSRYLDLTKVTLSGVLLEQARVQMDNGQLSEAVAKLNRASELTPDDERVAVALKSAQRDLDMKNAEESRQVYNEGFQLYLSGLTDKAEQKWRRALELDSTNEDALKALTKLEEQKREKQQQQ